MCFWPSGNRDEGPVPTTVRKIRTFSKPTKISNTHSCCDVFIKWLCLHAYLDYECHRWLATWDGVKGVGVPERSVLIRSPIVFVSRSTMRTFSDFVHSVACLSRLDQELIHVTLIGMVL